MALDLDAGVLEKLTKAPFSRRWRVRAADRVLHAAIARPQGHGDAGDDASDRRQLDTSSLRRPRRLARIHATFDLAEPLPDRPFELAEASDVVEALDRPEGQERRRRHAADVRNDRRARETSGRARRERRRVDARESSRFRARTRLDGLVRVRPRVLVVARSANDETRTQVERGAAGRGAGESDLSS